ncbi:MULTISPECIES: hypothetical protein [unclassified Streptomyces]|uniref:Uncharacterized protein n=1 Tax=Streptomyces lonegramiae TaxID=3075524 RepID=A0ABU2XKL0_9ACTN|nr:hypothetical protein [Streptomyces sp. DSM 41529]MDT0545999.1 hypothetical protein [Streptomyces sp. DSM 41529]
MTSDETAQTGGLMLTWFEATACGAGGGLIAEAVVTFGRLRDWQQARHTARVAGVTLPGIDAFVDPLADSLAALFRVVLGGAAGLLLHTEVTGMYAAVMVGASAPALLAQLGRATTTADALRDRPGGDEPREAASQSAPRGLSSVHDEAAS